MNRWANFHENRSRSTTLCKWYFLIEFHENPTRVLGHKQTWSPNQAFFIFLLSKDNRNNPETLAVFKPNLSCPPPTLPTADTSSDNTPQDAATKCNGSASCRCQSTQNDEPPQHVKCWHLGPPRCRLAINSSTRWSQPARWWVSLP